MVDKIVFPKEEIIDAKFFNIHQDWEVPIPGFFILAAKRKIRSISEFTDAESNEFMDLLRKIRKGMQDVLEIQTVYLFQNEDSEHNFHLWILPRYPWMEKFGSKIESVRLIMNYAMEHMATDDTIKETKQYVEKMRNYILDKNQNEVEL